MKQTPAEMFPRRKTVRIRVGNVEIGGGAPISVQSMTKTDTRDVRATAAEIRRLAREGCEIVRLAIPDAEAARAFARLRKQATVPLIADIHFDHRLALACLDGGADGLRLNPGTIGLMDKVREVVRAARERSVPIRIGVNSGSIEKDLLKTHGGATAEAMAESALRHIRILEDLDFRLIKVSLKASDLPRTLEAYRNLARKTAYPFHAGITEAGTLLPGAVKSAAGLALLLAEGLADTIRVSLTAPAAAEVRVAYRILAALGLRSRGVDVVSCPTCGRCEVDLRSIAREVQRRLTSTITPLTVAVMGCAVNGPGEAREADAGVACGRGTGVLFVKGKILRRVPEKKIAEALVREVDRITAGREKTHGRF
ncbi:MAG: flavodoxin-dependent (E)-4-hydroxy-3-methylbut-2-enyl-diphosphate synthase [Candidatus Aminicenantes bacterium]|nr:flavodoxin-dependent (E)-4-hydroxy-3-methylbut-2-enyl-diphosphate synthase [Candidatus Aminicenantes bacterium]